MRRGPLAHQRRKGRLAHRDPTPIRKSAVYSTGVLGPKPRSALKTRTRQGDQQRAPNAELRDQQRAGYGRHGQDQHRQRDKAPTAFSSRCSSRWMSGIRGGTASIVSRRSMPPSHKRSAAPHPLAFSLTRSQPRRFHTCACAGPFDRRLIGSQDPTRASVPFHIAVNGAKPGGTEVAIALAGDAAELVKPDVIATCSARPAAAARPHSTSAGPGRTRLRLKRLC